MEKKRKPVYVELKPKSLRITPGVLKPVEEKKDAKSSK